MQEKSSDFHTITGGSPHKSKDQSPSKDQHIKKKKSLRHEDEKGDGDHKYHKSNTKKKQNVRIAKKNKTIINEISNQISKQSVPTPDQQMTQVKLGLLQKLQLLFATIQLKLKGCSDFILQKIYSVERKDEYKRRQFSMKFFPVDEVIMCLDEYLYKFERMDNRDDFNKKNTDDDDESDDEDNQEVQERLRDKKRYFQFWQWNYMFIDNQDDKGRKRDYLKSDGVVEESEEEESDSEDDDDDDEEDQQQTMKIQSQFSKKLKEIKKEYSLLKRDVKALQKQYKSNHKEMEKLNQTMARLSESQEKLKEDYLEAIKRNKKLFKQQQKVFEVKESTKHISIKQY